MKPFSFYYLLEKLDKELEQISYNAGSTGNLVPAEDEDENVEEMAAPGWEGSVKKMKKHKSITNPWALSWYMKKQGAHPHYTKSGKKKQQYKTKKKKGE